MNYFQTLTYAEDWKELRVWGNHAYKYHGGGHVPLVNEIHQIPQSFFRGVDAPSARSDGYGVGLAKFVSLLFRTKELSELARGVSD